MIETILEYTMVYLLWTFVLWLFHWFAHKVPGPIHRVHEYHHQQFYEGTYDVIPFGWARLTGFYTSDWREMMEQVMIEIVPTIPVCILTGHWWPLLILWIDNAFISPYICHDRTVRKGWWLAVGVWHVDHHHNPAKNFGFYTIIWDVIFGTYKHPDPAPGPA